METFIAILVLAVLIGLLVGAAWFFGREAGPGNGMAWLTGNRSFVNIVPTRLRSEPVADSPRTTRDSALMVDDPRLLELADELRTELTRTLGFTSEFDGRLREIEREMLQSRAMPDKISAQLDERVSAAERSSKSELERLRQDVHAARTADSSYGLKRNEAVSDLYQKLAQIDVALGQVINPVLLPGEPIAVPDSLFEDTLVWANWQDVGDRAYAFGESFSHCRYLLEPKLANQVQEFIASFREALTGTVYPVVQNPNRTLAQRSQMRAGLIAVVEAIAPLRRELEQTWAQGSHINGFPGATPDA